MDLASATARHHVVLVAGFFGFGRLGDLTYFSGVREAITRYFEARGVPVAVTEVLTPPTASIRVRAARVLEALASVAASGPGPIHLVGHSTGGLDARLAIAPTASLPTSVEGFDYERVESLVSVCCPHFGTPVATFFSSTLGKPILRLCARYCIWVLERGRLPLAILLRLGYLIVRLRDPRRKRRSTFDELYEKLLNDFSAARRAELVSFLRAVSSDQSLLFQLTPAGCDLLNACTADPALRYGSVVARARRPSFRSFLRSVRDLYSSIVHPIYWVLHAIAARGEAAFLPPPVREQERTLIERYGELPSPQDNDGIIPTRSQIWGQLIHATEADHLDVVGQFGRVDEASWAGDWIPSYSGFTAEHFAKLWSDVAAFMLTDTVKQETEQKSPGTERTEQDLAAKSA